MCKFDVFKAEAKEKELTFLSKGKKRGNYLYQFDQCGHKKEFQPAKLRKINAICDICILEGFKKHAKENGLTLLSKGKKSKHYLYQFDSCGHTKEYKPSILKKHNPVCDFCQLERFKKEAKEKDLILLSKSQNKNCFFYNFIKCDHIIERTPREIKYKKQICEICQLEEFAIKAKEEGMTLLSKSKKSGYYLCQFDSCGHTKECKTSGLRKGNHLCKVCEVCELERFKKEAIEKGFTLLGKAKRGGYYIYKFDKCGHTKECKTSHLRKGNHICKVCDESHFHNESNIYLLHIYNDENSFLKLGVANDIETRIKDYKLDNSYKVKQLDSVLLGSKFIALDYETSIHKLYSNNKLNIDKMSKILKSGFTECYPLIMKNILLNEISKIHEYELN